MENIAKAIIAVMTEVKGIEKSMTVGSGNNSYKGVPDQEVKKIIGEAMERNGLCILPIGVTPNSQVSRWEQEEWDNYAKKSVIKTKQSVFTEVTTKYLLLHTSGESIQLEGYGHGVDSQDKGAGKATTYALKYTLLYTFLVPTGKIDDADATHSEAIEAPVLVKEPTQAEKAKGVVKQTVKPLTDAELSDIQESLSLVNDMEEFKKYFKSLTKDIQQDPGALELFKYRNEELKQLQLV